MRGVLKEFRDFAFRGNMLDLAVGVIIGAAFGAVVNSLAKDVLMNFVAVLFGKPDFSAVVWRICRGTAPTRCTNIGIGNLLTLLVNFLIVAFVLFLVIKAVNRMLPRPKTVEAKKTRDCPYCLTAIPLEATKCSACTSPVDPPAPPPSEPEPAAAD
jgi:large conductance mechanosensitive channel